MKYELIRSTLNPIRWFWWNFIPGTKIQLNLKSDYNNVIEIVEWLEHNAGPHRKMWDMRATSVTHPFELVLTIKFHRKKEYLSSIALLCLQ